MHMSDSSIVVEECHRTTGEWCLLVKIRARSSASVEAFLDRMRDDENVQATMTTLALSTLRS
jgi:Lrp/AsnC family leucine-responsive transcriptional regulator